MLGVAPANIRGLIYGIDPTSHRLPWGRLRGVLIPGLLCLGVDGAGENQKNNGPGIS